MTTLTEPKAYTTLINDITTLYNHAHRALVESYWEIGRLIVEQERRVVGKEVYTKQLIERLSEDLSQQFGSGFSRRNLYKMRQFFLAHKSVPAPARMSWTQHVELLSVTNQADKKDLEQRIIREGLSPRQIRQEVSQIKNTQAASSQGEAPIRLPEPNRSVALQSYGLIPPDRTSRSRGNVVVDCGFNIWHEIPKIEAGLHGDPSYTYPAKVESVIDGDTLWVVVDCGDRILTRQKLRLHLIDTPERGTPEGDKATRFVKRMLNKNPHIVICTHHYDKYARYLADVFYSPDTSNPKAVYAKGIYLNQQLLDKGLAQLWRP
jgi:endonuclease YncB( thermonuclease family)